MTFYEILTLTVAVIGTVISIVTLFIIVSNLGLQVDINKQQADLLKLTLEKDRREIMPFFKVELLNRDNDGLPLKIFGPGNHGTDFRIIVNDKDYLHIAEQEVGIEYHRYFINDFKKLIILNAYYGEYYTLTDVPFGRITFKDLDGREYYQEITSNHEGFIISPPWLIES